MGGKDKEKKEDKIIKVFVIFMLLFMFFLFSTQGLNKVTEEDCEILLCQYESAYYASITILLILGLPSLLFYLIMGGEQTMFSIFIAQILLISWLFLLSFLSYNILTFIGNTGRKMEGKLKGKKNKKKPGEDFHTIFKLVIYLNAIFFVSMMVLGLLFYPEISIDVDIGDYLLVSGLLVAILTLFIGLNKKKNKEVIKLERGLIDFSFFLIFLSTMGMLINFVNESRIGSDDTFLDLASLNALNLGIFGGILMGLFSTMFLIMYSYSKILKKG